MFLAYKIIRTDICWLLWITIQKSYWLVMSKWIERNTIDNDFLQLNQRILWHKIFMTCLHNRLCKSLNYCKSTFQFNELFDFSDRFHKWATKVEGQKNLNYFSFSIWKTTLFSKLLYLCNRMEEIYDRICNTCVT